MKQIKTLRTTVMAIAMTVGTLLTGSTSAKATDVIAHRGFWKTEGSAQNSRSSLWNAINADCWGSETDVYLTTDGHLIVNHDPTREGVKLEDATYKQCKNMKLDNGEKMPQLKDLLKIMQKAVKKGKRTKLIIEIKPHSSPERNYAAARAIINEVERYGMKEHVEYISFSHYACDAVLTYDASAKVAYLSGNYTPQQCKERKYTGIDYEQGVLIKHPEWIKECHNLGMEVNVWTVNDRDKMNKLKNMGVDFITTNEPKMTKEVCGK